MKASRWAIFAVVTGLVLRMTWIAWSGFRIHFPDEIIFDESARVMLTDHKFGYPDGDSGSKISAYRMPGLAAFLATLYAVFRPAPANLMVGRFFIGLLGALGIWILFLLGRLLFSDEVGAVAAWIFALHPVSIFFSGSVLTEIPFTVCVLTAFVLDAIPFRKTWNAVANGLMWALALMVRVTVLPFILINLAIRLWRARVEKRIRQWIFFAVGALILPVLWGVRNVHYFGRFALDFHGGGYWIIAPVLYPELFRKNSDLAFEEMKRQPWYPKTLTMNEAELDQFGWKLAVRSYMSDPARTARLLWNNFIQFWRLYPKREGSELKFQLDLLIVISILTELPIIGLGMVGFIVARKTWLQWFTLPLFGVSLMGIHVLSITQMRYRYPVMPILMLFAAVALHRLWLFIRPRFS